MSTFEQGRYLICTRPPGKKAAAHLHRHSVQTCLPLVETLRRWHDRRTYVELPLFPSYIFVYRTNMPDCYDPMKCEAVLHYVSRSRKNVRVNDNIIKDVRPVADRGTNREIGFDTFETGKAPVTGKVRSPGFPAGRCSGSAPEDGREC